MVPEGIGPRGGWWRRAAAGAVALAMLGGSAGAGWSASAEPGDAGTERVSVATGGQAAGATSHGIDLSADGSVAAFGSNSATLVPGGTSTFDIYVRDRARGVTEIVSVSDSGQSGSTTSLRPTISGDATRVAFESRSSNLVAGDDNGQPDVFVRDRAARRTILVSASPDGTPGNGGSQRSEISADGRHVVFVSSATDLVPGVPDGVAQVYIHHLDSGETELVSRGTDGPADRSAASPSVSSDGRYVVFQTFATPLVPGPPFAYLYVRDTVTDTTTVVPGASSVQAGRPAVSGDGRYVAYSTSFTQYVVDRVTGNQVAVGGTGRKSAARFSDDGRYLAFFEQPSTDSTYRLYVWDRITGQTTEASLTDSGDPVASGAEAPETFGGPGISNDGRIVGFWTSADNVVAGDTDGRRDVFARDRGDLLGPDVDAVVVEPEAPIAQQPLQVSAEASDASRGGAVIASVELSIDGGEWRAMQPTDGSFDEVTEQARLEIDGLGSGAAEICVRAIDGRGNVTEQPSCTSVSVSSTATPLAVTITRVAETTGFVSPLLGHVFARVWAIPGDGGLPQPGQWDYDTRADPDAQDFQFRRGVIEPFGTHGETIVTGSGEALVRIEAGAQNQFGVERLIDLNPASSDQGLVLRVDLATGEWRNLDGSVTAPVSCVNSVDGADPETLSGQMCFSVSTLSTSGDLDGDGLLDHWESVGLSMDTDPDIELDLPGWGATPDHKDLFVEYDVEDDAQFDSDVTDGLIAVQRAFLRAPIDAGGTPNPDGKPGIRLWIDSPAVIRLPGSNAGQFVSTPSVCGVDDGFYQVKRANFDRDRRWVFRYALKESNDGECDSGGQAEIGGNDFVVLNSDALDRDPNTGRVIYPGGETFMHELGHSLGLRHGGFENRNRKPNYVSLMNYRYSFTLRQPGGLGYLDFSPPVPPSPTGVAVPRPGLLPDFAEVAPPQGQVLGADRDHTIRYASRDCQLAVIAATDPFELFPSDPGTTDRVPHPGADAKLADLPSSCTQAIAGGLPFIQTHRDHDDWAAVRLPFQRSGDAADAAIDPSDDQDLPTDDEIDELRSLDRTIDLALDAGPTDDPVTVGTTVTVPVTVSNVGSVHSAGASLAVDGASGPTSVVLDELAPGVDQTVQVQVPTSAPGTITVQVSVDDELMIEATPQDNSLTFDVVVVDAASGTDDGDSADGATTDDTSGEGSASEPSPSPSPPPPPLPLPSPSPPPLPSPSPPPLPSPSLSPPTSLGPTTPGDTEQPSALAETDSSAQGSEQVPEPQPGPVQQAEPGQDGESDDLTSASPPGSARPTSSVTVLLLALLAVLLLAATGTAAAARRR